MLVASAFYASALLIPDYL